MNALQKFLAWLSTSRGLLLVLALVLCVAILRHYEIEAASGTMKLHLTPR